MPERRTSAPPRGRPPAPPPVSRRRIGVVAAVAVLCIGALVAYLVVQRRADDAAAAAAAADEAARARLAVEDVLAVPHLVVRTTEPGPSYGQVALVPLSDPDGPRAVLDLSCERISAVERGAICLQEVPGLVTTYRAVLLDGDLTEVGTQDLGGIPSRARMSSGGSYAASTVFVTGHAYTDAQFSTETVITEMAGRTSLGNLETWTTLRDGVAVTAEDRNFWGVSFVGDGPAFYATMGTGGERYLVRGDVTTRTLTVAAENGACPSVSADGTTVVLKEQDPESRNDHFVALDLASGGRTPLTEGRIVDDQVTWLDDGRVLYSVGKGVASSVDFDVWVADVDGGQPVLLVPDASSPSVVGGG
ncbi:TolB family protein [Geodermatophilus sp. SYSU D01045]